MSSTRYETLKSELRKSPRRWLVTGGAGFIGSHLIETLLGLDQNVVCFDNFATGFDENLETVRGLVAPEQADRLSVIRGDLADYEACLEACSDIDHVLHQGALGSVPWSIDDPVESHRANATGTLNLFQAANKQGIRRVVYASSSAVYGDDATLPKVEEITGRVLSPYASTKAIAEVYAESFSACYGTEFAGLRYFNVFGPRQDPNGPYAAVIPIWIASMVRGEPIYINGDGETSRDFIFVGNVVQANLLAAAAQSLIEPARVFNIAFGTRTTLNQLFGAIRDALKTLRPEIEVPDPIYRDFRPGDIRHSHADLSRASAELEFHPTFSLSEGLALAMPSYLEQVGNAVTTP